ncbi:MAG: hypothetical protein QOE10_506 [Gaiellales bacterium]|nr:hypothetical protein [Gaiellales bacterium]
MAEMTATDETDYLAECFLPGVREADLEALDARAEASAAALSAAGGQVRYLGSLLLLADEVVLCLYAGSRDSVHEAARRADLPFERILETASSPWATTRR